MKLFISWSGIRSKKIAERLNEFLKGFLQGSEPFFSDEDIAKGAKWFETISDQLEQTNFGIICLTKENRSSPWIFFEAGALAKNLKIANVCPILFGLDYSDVEGPLSQFQLAAFNKPDIHKLCGSINSKLSRQLDYKTFDKLFDTLWPEAEKDIWEIISDDLPQLQVSGKSNKEILEDIWYQVRKLNYTETQALNDKFVEQLVEGLKSHVSSLVENNLASELSTLQEVLSPIEYLISQVKDTSIKASLIKRYEKTKSQITTPAQIRVLS